MAFLFALNITIMNILELDSYNLADAVKFNEQLNPRIWQGNKMRPQVRAKLLQIAEDFKQSLGLSDLNVKDITLSGSNASYTYTPHSDIDLHLVVDLPEADASEVYRELFDAKKFQYNETHNIKIGGYDVELYVENANEPPVSQGMFSVLNDDWINIPLKKRSTVNDNAVKSKYDVMKHRIESAVKSGSLKRLTNTAAKIKKMRQAGLDKHGELGPENIAYKMLRSQGVIQQLYDARTAAKDRELSLKERTIEIDKPFRFTYGFKTTEDVGASWDGVSPTTQMFLNEEPKADEDILTDFVEFCVAELKIEQMPHIRLRKDPQWPVMHKTFGRYINDKKMLEVAWGQRHIMDVLRTVAHELTHKHQHERDGSGMGPDAGETGSPWENEANARAGVLMRDYARLHPEYFAAGQADELTGLGEEKKFPEKISRDPRLSRIQRLAKGHYPTVADPEEAFDKWLIRGLEHSEQNDIAHDKKISKLEKQVTDLQKAVVNSQVAEASGYIPTKKQAKDPRFSMALTKDIRPGAVGKEANKLNLQTDAQGHPELLMTGLANALREFKETGKLASKSHGYNSTPLSQVPGEQEDDLGNQEATGPEFPPQMPAGTTKIDVGDLTDWYQLGMDISDLDDAKPEDYNQGPPQTVIVFPSDQAEQGYLKQFKRLGLKTHDIDPDVEGGEDVTNKHQPKTDEDLIAESIDDMLFEINMSTGSLRREAAKTGAIAGMEFEMIVPNVEGDDDDGDMEPDYEYDESVGSIQDAYDFFYDGDYNSRGDVSRLREKMQNEYYEWLGEAFDSRWDGDQDEFVYNYLKENASADEIAEILGVELGEDGEYVADKQAYRDATEKVIEEGYGNYWYDQAREDAQEDFNQNADLESEWLESRDLNRMSDIENEYGMSWPHWNTPGGGERSIDDVANDFQDAIGRDVQASGNYHSRSVERPGPSSQHYIVEPDGSLDGDDYGDRGLEFVSPPLPIDVILNDLNKVKRWADSYGCYTNDSTGLHINISVPNYSRENLDFVKLALLMGDEYVLDLFDRSGNTYAKSAMKLVRDQVRQKPDEAKKLLDKMKENLGSLASKAIHSGITEKRTSINTKDGHIEFRSPGGDWLDENFDKIENTLLRFTVAMSAALNPEMYREEYLKKLYKLLTQDTKGDDTIKYFSEYVAGKIPAAALRSFVKQAQLERKLKKDPTVGKKYWWNVSWGNGRVEVVATSQEQAIDTAFKESYWAPDEPDTPQAKQFRGSLRATPLRPYEEQAAKTVRYEIYNKQTGNSVEDAPAGVGNDEDALTFLNDYIDHGPHALQRRQASDMFGIRTPNGVEIVGLDIPMAQGRAATSPTGQWKIVDGLNREVYRFRPAVNTRAKANEIAALWARENNFDGNYQVEPAEEAQSGPRTDRPFVWKVQGTDSPRQRQGIEVVASNELEAMQKARQQWNLNTGGTPEQEFFRLNGWIATPVRPAEEAQSGPRTDRPFVWKVIGSSDSPYQSQGIEVVASSEFEAMKKARQQWNLNTSGATEEDFFRANGWTATPVRPAEETQPGSTTDLAQQRATPGTFTGAWKIVDSNGNELYRFSGVGNQQRDANRVATQWMQNNGYDYGTEIEVLPIMS